MVLATSTASEFVKVGKDNPCPICNKSDWCKVSPDGNTAMCGRTGTIPIGWKKIKDTVDGQGIYKLETGENLQKQVSGRRPTKKVKKAPPAPPVPHSLKLAKTEGSTGPDRLPISDTLWSIVRKEISKKTPGISRDNVQEIAYSYGGDKTVYRAEWTDATSTKGYRKTYRQSHVDDGLVKWEKGKAIWNAYRIDEVLAILGDTPVNEPVAPLMVEGEPNVEIARSHGIAATTLQGSNWTEEQIKSVVTELQRVNCRALLYLYDNDETGLAKANKIKDVCDRLQFPCILIDPNAISPNIPEKGDIKEILAEMSAEEFIQRIEDELHSKAQEDKEHRENLAIGDDDDSKNGKKKGKDLPPPSQVADELAEICRDKLAWESEYQQWRHYGAKHDGAWDVETTESVKRLIHTHLRSQGLPGFNSGYISSIATILQSDLEVQDWNEQTGLIPVRDGVLNQLTQEIKPHAPGYRFTYQLPFRWADRLIGCQPIEDFLLKITGNQSIADVLLAYLSAIVTRRSDLQRYLEIKGGGGTGKSTYMTLARDLVGSDNTVSSQLKHLENNQFETAKFYGKSLALFPDSERWQGEVSVLKQLTGQDPIRYERKGVQQCKDFIFKGMAMLSANEAPESRDLTSGQERRKLTIELDIKVPEYADRELSKEFQPYLPGLLKRVLDIPPTEVTRLIKHTDREVPALAQVKWKQLCETNPIAGWLEEKAIINPEAKGYIGLGDIDQAGRWLYANFCKYQQDNGHKNSVSMKRFSLNLRDLLKNQMKVAIAEGRDRDGSYLYGVGLRCQLDPAGERYPCPVTKKPFCDGFVTSSDGFVTVETLADVGFDGYAGFSENLENKTNDQIHPAENQCKKDAEILPMQFCGGDGERNPPNPSNPTSANIPAVTNPSQTHHKPIAKPLTVSDSDAEILRDIALSQWPESYPNRLQALMSKLCFGSGIGKKYGEAMIITWLESEDVTVRSRIANLYRISRGLPITEEP